MPVRASLLRQAFQQNASERERRVKQPEILGDVALPVSRWYRKGSDGARWDGALAAREKKSIQVIGYAGRALEPGARVDATIRFESMSARATARARPRWNAE